MIIRAAQFSHPGPEKENEDCLLGLTQIDTDSYAAVADGLGGHAGGRIASETAVGAIKENIRHKPHPTMMDLFGAAVRELRLAAANDEALKKMATTLSIIRLSNSSAEIGHVGDSRIYHLRGDGIVARTIDQTEAQHLIDRGVLSKAEGRKYHRRNVLLSVLSPAASYDLYQQSFGVVSGDRIILVTDGVYRIALRREIRDISKRSVAAENFCTHLEAFIRERGPIDDFSAVCLDIVDAKA